VFFFEAIQLAQIEAASFLAASMPKNTAERRKMIEIKNNKIYKSSKQFIRL